MRTIPLIVVLILIALQTGRVTAEGLIYAVLSGSLASGVGYTLWYMALRGLSATQAAVIQLSVPVIAALGGIVFVGEALTLRLSMASRIILGGILLVISGRAYFVNSPASIPAE